MSDTAITTRSGRYIDLADPRPETIDIDDMAWALAHLCRFTGHTSRFYSVASHSLLVAAIADRLYGANPYLRLYALLHDFIEAYFGDPSSPMRRLPQFAAMQELERVWEEALYSSTGMTAAVADPVMRRALKHCDMQALLIENRDLMGGLIIVADKTIHPAVAGLTVISLPSAFDAHAFLCRMLVDDVNKALRYVRTINEKGVPEGDPACFCLHDPASPNRGDAKITTTLCPYHWPAPVTTTT